MIHFKDVTRYLGGRPILNGMTLDVEQGETYVIVGASGTGKSVTLKHMVRLLTPDTGEVWVGDECVSRARGNELAKIRMRFGYLFQSAALLQWCSVGTNVGLPLMEHTGMSRDEIETVVREKLELVGLEEAYDKFPAELSGGMQKRVALARAIIMQPEIILYDEPTSGLDPVTSRTIDRLIDDMRKELGVTSVVVTHDLHSALVIGTRIAMIDQGQVIEVAAPEEFVKSDRPEVQRFLEAQYITTRGEWERT